jgi:hypothetical protein
MELAKYAVQEVTEIDFRILSRQKQNAKHA